MSRVSARFACGLAHLPDLTDRLAANRQVFVEFATPEQAAKARSEVEGRQLANRTVRAEFMNEDRWAKRDLSD